MTLILITVLFLGHINDPIIHKCHYQMTFVARKGLAEQRETITVTINRPVNLQRIYENWLRKDDGADLNEDGVVNWMDYAIWAKEVQK